MSGAGLFQLGDFTLASGERSSWKIECDALAAVEWEALAAMLVERLPFPFSWVRGVPRGGEPLAEALTPYVSEGGPVLVVDDVWTSGVSMQRYIDTHVQRLVTFDVRRAVVFARNPVPADVVALFQMTGAVRDR